MDKRKNAGAIKMKIEKLYYFLSVARNLNFTRAAQECHIAQPAISRQMHSLEEELGFLLFDRTSRKVRLTAAGEAFYQNISQFIKDYEGSVAELQQMEPGKHHLTIEIGILGEYHLLTQALNRLRASFPEMQLECSSSSSQPIHWLTQGEGDMVFTWNDYHDLPDTIVQETLVHRRCALYLSEEHPLAQEKRILKSQLIGQNLILPAIGQNREFAKFYRQRLRELGIPIDGQLLSQDRESLYFLIRNRMGISVLPQGILDQHSSGITSREIAGAGEFGQWKVLYRRDITNPMVYHLLEFLKE
jgi:DNA-binding transcriptional LysR family regulator